MRWHYSINLFSKIGDKGREGQKSQKMGEVIYGRPLRKMAAFLSNIPCIVLTSFQVKMLQNCVYILHIVQVNSQRKVFLCSQSLFVSVTFLLGKKWTLPAAYSLEFFHGFFWDFTLVIPLTFEPFSIPHKQSVELKIASKVHFRQEDVRKPIHVHRF